MADTMRTTDYVLMVLMTYHLLRWWWRLNRRRVKKLWQRTKDYRRRKRHPKSPKDCPQCRGGIRLKTARVNREVKPWGEVKSKRGRQKKYPTQGYACLNASCAYFGIINEGIHALVRHTTRGKDKDIPYLRCQACRTVFSSRKGTTRSGDRGVWLAEGLKGGVAHAESLMRCNIGDVSRLDLVAMGISNRGICEDCIRMLDRLWEDDNYFEVAYYNFATEEFWFHNPKLPTP